MADNDQQMRQPEAVAGAPVPVLITRNGKRRLFCCQSDWCVAAQRLFE